MIPPMFTVYRSSSLKTCKYLSALGEWPVKTFAEARPLVHGSAVDVSLLSSVIYCGLRQDVDVHTDAQLGHALGGRWAAPRLEKVGASWCNPWNSIHYGLDAY